MGKHIPPLTERRGNIILAEDGSRWCNYLLTGINVNSYRPETATAAQDSHELLYTALSRIPSDDIMLTGIRRSVDPLETMQSITAGIPDWDPQRYQHLGGLLNDFYRRMVSGEFAQFDRVFWLAVSQPSRRRMSDRLAATVLETDVHEGTDWTDIAEFERSCFEAIPAEFSPRRTTPAHVEWVFERATTRGLGVPKMYGDRQGPVANSESAYPEVSIDTAAESTALYSTFTDDLATGRKYAVALTGKRTKQSLRRRFTTLRDGKVLAFSHPSTRTAQLPDGRTSYQTMLGVARYPSRLTPEVSSFTYLVDQALGVDADFTLRIRFDESLTDTRHVSNTEKDLVSEEVANAEDEFQATDYDDRRLELRRFHDAVRSRTGSPGMQVTAIFAFGSDNLDYLSSRVAAVQQRFSANDYETLVPVGGGLDLWRQMMPGSVRSRLGTDLLQTSTAFWFSGAMPIRRSHAGDSVGVPVAINKENANGQIILLDLLNATDRGNASIAITGAQGGGKSNLMKLIFLFVTLLNRYGTAIDHSQHGEWAVYARQLARTQVVNAATGRTPQGYVSTDPLKCLPSPVAETTLMAHYLPLFELSTKSEEAAYLAKVLHPEFRRVRGINSTRRLIEYLSTAGEAEAKTLRRHFEHWAALPYAAAMIDPPARGHDDTGLPAFDNLDDLAARMESGATPHATVFRTHELPVYRGENPSGGSDLNKWAASVYGTLARMTAYRFGRIRGTCVFFGDEISFLKGNEDVVELLIRSPDRTGRKDANFIVAGSQHAEDFDHNYAMIEKKAALRQKTRTNAASALEMMDMPAIDSLLDRMVYDTSPPDPLNNNMTREGRYGEGWWNDGTGNTVRVQFLPILSPSLARFADTTSSKMIRESDLDAADARDGAVAMMNKAAAPAPEPGSGGGAHAKREG